MKYTIAIALCIMILTGCVRYHSERIRDGKTSITIKESDHQYRMDAKFSRSKTAQVARMIDEALDDNGSLDTHDLNGNITLDDDTKLYIRLRSGRLKIRFNKDANSETAYDRIKELGDKIKITIHSNQVQLQ